jgi:hypothetical protein
MREAPVLASIRRFIARESAGARTVLIVDGNFGLSKPESR